MNWKTSAIIAVVISSFLPTTVAAATCESLKSVSLANVTITTAENVPAGPFVQPGGGGGAPTQAAEPIPAHCRVKLVLKPSSDSNINAELWLPAANWNGKFMAVGNGGFGGAIQGYGDMQVALRRGYATAGNDTGHTAADGPGGMFGLGHPEKIVDFSHRAMHEMTLTAKRLIDEFYGKAPQFSYYKGCSTGGRQGVMAAQRFPEDFDGIIAGALANRHIHQHTAGVARSIELARHPEGAIPAKKAEMVSKALLNACDTYKEGFVNNPRACSFDFSKLACSGEDTENCLTAAQLKTVETFYGGVKNSKGELIFSGQALSNPLPALSPPTDVPPVGTTRFASGAFRTRSTTGARSISIATCRSSMRRSASWMPTDPDLTRFKARGGKLVLYAGWGDTGITPENTVAYYDSVVDKMGKKQDVARLFMVPGMGHCRGGVGPNTFDTIGTLEAWREKGTTPTEITAFNPQSGLSRPLCAYPQFAKYTGTGNMKDAANWKCTAP